MSEHMDIEVIPSLIPDGVYGRMHAVLTRRIPALLADPKTRREFEEWKARKEAKERGESA